MSGSKILNVSPAHNLLLNGNKRVVKYTINKFQAVFLLLILLINCMQNHEDQFTDIDVYLINKSENQIRIEWADFDKNIFSDSIVSNDTAQLIKSSAFLCNLPNCVIESIKIIDGTNTRVIDLKDNSLWISREVNEFHYKYYYVYTP